MNSELYSCSENRSCSEHCVATHFLLLGSHMLVRRASPSSQLQLNIWFSSNFCLWIISCAITQLVFTLEEQNHSFCGVQQRLHPLVPRDVFRQVSQTVTSFTTSLKLLSLLPVHCTTLGFHFYFRESRRLHRLLAEAALCSNTQLHQDKEVGGGAINCHPAKRK